jgi:hypothetical protein
MRVGALRHPPGRSAQRCIYDKVVAIEQREQVETVWMVSFPSREEGG